MARSFEPGDRGGDFDEKLSPTPASPPAKMIAAVAQRKGLPPHKGDVSQAFVEALLKEEIFRRLLSCCGELSGRNVRLKG